MNHTSNKNQPDLLPPSGVKPISGTHASPAQILVAFPFLAGQVDDAFLRNRAREINPRTGAPWIPKPVSGRYQLDATIAGLLEWFHAHQDTGLPGEYPSMAALEASPLGIPREFTRWAVRNGCGDAQHASGRINPRPILAKAADILRQIANGNISGIDGMEILNKDQELARNIRLQSEKLQDEKLLRRGEMLMSRDQTWAINQLVADEILWEKRDQPLRAALINAPKAINRQHKNILKNAAQVDDLTIKRCAEITINAINEVLKKLRAKIPQPIADNESD